MQTDSRLSFSVSHGCGSFDVSGNSMRFTVDTACRRSSVTVSVVATIGGVTVVGTRNFDIEWLASVELELYYQHNYFLYTLSEIRYRYASDCGASSFHSLRVRTRGTTSSNRQWFLNTGAVYAVSTATATLSNSGETRELTVN